ncbi:hypothetical protein BJF88_14270 [Cellulosimicrobium sp. CUA-896]|nr:hypothetical protein BJF88_14270 [Cellulosimicrobium sp. CUA-896]
MKTRPGCCTRYLRSSNSLYVRSMGRPRSRAVYPLASMASSPAEISCGPSSAGPFADRSTTSRSRASTSAGVALSSSRSSAPHSAVTTVRPPSVSTSTSGTASPVACSSRHVVRAATRSRRASSRTTSESGASTSADGSIGSTRMRWDSRPRAGRTSTEPPVAGVRISRSAMPGTSFRGRGHARCRRLVAL